MDETNGEEITHVMLTCAYYQGRRVVESAHCGNCRAKVYDNETHCSECKIALNWEDEIEDGHGSFMGIYT